MKNGQKSIRLNPIHSETLIQMNLNQYEAKFLIQVNPNQCESFKPWINSDFLKLEYETAGFANTHNKGFPNKGDMF